MNTYEVSLTLEVEASSAKEAVKEFRRDVECGVEYVYSVEYDGQTHSVDSESWTEKLSAIPEPLFGIYNTRTKMFEHADTEEMTHAATYAVAGKTHVGMPEHCVLVRLTSQE